MAGNELRFRATLDDKVSSGLGKINDKFALLGKSKGAQSILAGVGVGAGVKALGLLQGAMGGVEGVVQDSIAAASDLAETQSKVGVVFGKSAKDIETWGKGAAQSLGLSQQAAEEAAGSLGNLFTGIGQSQGEAAKMSKSVVTLASDLASFNNIDPTEALDKLRSGLAGEAEPLRSMGVFLSEAKVKAKAMQLGLGDAHGELTEGEKILARYQVILDETKNAQGDFAKTADGEANSQRRLNAELRDSEALLGKRLLPVQKKVTDGAIDLFTGLGRVLTASDLTTDGLRAQADIYMRLSTIAGPFAQVGRDNAAALYAAADAGDAWVTSFDNVAGSSETVRLKLLAADAAVNGFAKDLETGLGPKSPVMFAGKGFGSLLGTNIRSGQDDVLAASDALLAEMKKPFLDKKKLQDILSGKGSMGKRLEAGLNSARPNVREAAEALRDDLIRQLQGVVDIEIHPHVVSHAKAKHRALGGPVEANEAYTVGEHGPETLVMGGQGGSIIPNGGGGPVTIELHVDGRVLAQVVDDHLYYNLSRASPSATRK